MKVSPSALAHGRGTRNKHVMEVADDLIGGYKWPPVKGKVMANKETKDWRGERPWRLNNKWRFRNVINRWCLAEFFIGGCHIGRKMKSGIERADDVYVVITWIPLTTYPSLSTLFIVFLSGPDFGSERKTGVGDTVWSSCGSDIGGPVFTCFWWNTHYSKHPFLMFYAPFSLIIFRSTQHDIDLHASLFLLTSLLKTYY